MTKMLVIPENVKKRILSKIMDFIHAEDLRFNDDFPIKIANLYVSLIEEKSELPNQKLYLKSVNKIRTTFFRLNTGITKKRLLEDLLNELNREFEPIFNEIRKKRLMKEVLPSEPFYERIYVDDIDSFGEVRKVSAKAIKEQLPLTIPEKEVKASFAAIIGENFVPKDWSGEKSDLYSSHVIYKGKRRSTAFLLKGPSVKRLTIDKLGKRGNQILRLVKEPAELFVVQHNGEIDTDVVEFLETCVSDLSRKKSVKLYYSVIDGVDTARVLIAYNKLKK
jgi:hypothetical protein